MKKYQGRSSRTGWMEFWGWLSPLAASPFVVNKQPMKGQWKTALPAPPKITKHWKQQQQQIIQQQETRISRWSIHWRGAIYNWRTETATITVCLTAHKYTNTDARCTQPWYWYYHLSSIVSDITLCSIARQTCSANNNNSIHAQPAMLPNGTLMM